MLIKLKLDDALKSHEVQLQKTNRQCYYLYGTVEFSWNYW